MARTDMAGEQAYEGALSEDGKAGKARFLWRDRLWLGSLVALPYLSYMALVVMLGLFIAALVRRGGQVMGACAQRGFGWLAAGMLLSACFAIDKGEGFLQLTNFLPFFVMFGVMATVPSVVARPFEKLEFLAHWLLVSSIPMSLGAIAEFIIKFKAISPSVKALPLPDWLIAYIYEPDFGHRAHSFFGHPNMLSAYLAIVLGLGLGLMLKALNTRRNDTIAWMQGAALLVCVVSIFCTGSRNGLLISGVLIAIALYAARRHRWVLLCGLSIGAFLVSAAFAFGIGGRSLSLALVTQDPRLGVWRLAIEMIQQRPWLGWGFSGLRQLYIPGSIPEYDVIFHAHNFWLFLASEAGLPVTVAFCAVIGTIYYDGVKVYLNGGLAALKGGDRAILLGYLLAFASCILFGLFDVAVFDARVNLFNWGLVAAIYILSRSALPKPD
ncbi:MAG: hypothetical protein DCF25_09140 [Leptolyngbya foveolarum]|uniref:O-antigen ligase-related domain-containing protein n=1 Tax=Leptolyngbya foveolarum TaxID=47253 RepID=A0A2W4UEL5_9CYAN|nr:MAG: hypothetical protein DCF25_09140 [Leptolyngbya foveolarum]